MKLFIYLVDGTERVVDGDMNRIAEFLTAYWNDEKVKVMVKSFRFED